MREIKAKQILESGGVRRINSVRYEVKSQSSDRKYSVILTDKGWECNCPDHMERGVTCKHAFAVKFSLSMRDEVRKNVVIEPVSISGCIFCHSPEIVKTGVRKNREIAIQRFKCKTCNRTFSLNIGFEKMKHNPKAITTAMQLYFSGESLRNTMRALKLLGVQVSHQTIYNWIGKYVSLMEEYLDRITPQVSDVWRTDEIYLKVRGNLTYLFSMMDDETRFWISQMVADNKGTSDVRPMYQEAKQITGKRPAVFISDGAANFHDAYRKEFYLNRQTTKHIRHIQLAGDKNNNKMERMNGEIRDREKVFRGLKTKDSPILKDYQLYHNYVRPHESLNGKTPADACGIVVEGNDKWMTIIQNSAKIGS